MTNSKYNFPNAQKVQIFEQVDTYIENNSNPIPHSSNHPTATPSQTPPPPDSLKLFFSYTHKDEPLRDQLATHLSQLKRDRIITDWCDRNITAGTEWAQAIDDNLNTADIILLLISADFLASDYCWTKEMDPALERHNQGTARVIPIILRPCDWYSAPFGKLQALPEDAKPVTQWADPDEAFTHIAQGIRTAITELQQRKTSPTAAPPNPSSPQPGNVTMKFYGTVHGDQNIHPAE
jgi:TIR domain